MLISSLARCVTDPPFSRSSFQLFTTFLSSRFTIPTSFFVIFILRRLANMCLQLVTRVEKLFTWPACVGLAGVYKKEKPKITCKEKSSVHHAPHSCDFEVDVCRKIDFHKPDIDQLCKKMSRIDGWAFTATYFTVKAFCGHFFLCLRSDQVGIFLVWKEDTVAGDLETSSCIACSQLSDSPWQDFQMSRDEQIGDASRERGQFWTFWDTPGTARTHWQCGFSDGFEVLTSGWIAFRNRRTHRVSLLCALSCVDLSCSHGRNLSHRFHRKTS